MAVCILYASYGDNEPKIIALRIFGLASAILFPFSLFLIEKTALRYTKKEFWETGFFKDGVPKTYLMTLYLIFIFMTSIPIGVISVFFEIKNVTAKL
ncbi:colicin E1 family microcin immunity protein [Hafnia alvei]|uniref:colicin E1 family microcin immunity protein n=1 Tax=Hafnia alvei TaxID=569 RepID=UPI0018B02B1B|nr:colicin E1 family microcin immunity protein [Hafnia alvei]MBW3478505.1 colicin E1 immunity protein [Hafnia alvei]